MNFTSEIWGKIWAKTNRIGLFFAKPHILFYLLPWLMFLTVMGTISQKDIGLYDAVEKYFSSIVLWIGPVPTPGGLATIGILFVSLLIKFVFYSPWSLKKTGIILTHLGVLTLLLGGIVTALSNKEGFMIIPEGRNISTYSDYYNRTLYFKTDGETIKTVSFDNLQVRDQINYDALEIKIIQKCDNCAAKAPDGTYENLQGLAQNMMLYGVKSEIQKEANFSGLTIRVADQKNPDHDGVYIIMEDIQKNPIFKTPKGSVEISLDRQKTELPFAIGLKDFQKIDYSGTRKAREYKSEIIVLDNKNVWPATISMNKPLRYRGYSFYQSSFDQTGENEITVLNVVKNEGRYFPYISTLIIFLGLLTHIIIHLKSKDR